MEMQIEILKLALFIVVSQLVLSKIKAFVSGWLGILPKGNSKPQKSEHQLQVDKMTQQIQEMKQEAETFNDPSSFVKYAKMQRKIAKLQQQLQLKKAQSPKRQEKGENRGDPLIDYGNLLYYAFQYLFKAFPYLLSIFFKGYTFQTTAPECLLYPIQSKESSSCEKLELPMWVAYLITLRTYKAVLHNFL